MQKQQYFSCQRDYHVANHILLGRQQGLETWGTTMYYDALLHSQQAHLSTVMYLTKHWSIQRLSLKTIWYHMLRMEILTFGEEKPFQIYFGSSSMWLPTSLGNDRMVRSSQKYVYLHSNRIAHTSIKRVAFQNTCPGYFPQVLSRCFELVQGRPMQ